MSDLGLKLKDPPAPHFYVGPLDDDFRAPRRDGCRRDGCGLPPEHAVHLRPPGDPVWDERARRATA